MNFGLSDDEKALQETARKFARDVMRPRAAHYDEKSEFPREIIQQASELGLMNLTIPAEHGGVELPHVAQAIIAEELSWGCAGMATSMIVKNFELSFEDDPSSVEEIFALTMNPSHLPVRLARRGRPRAPRSAQPRLVRLASVGCPDRARRLGSGAPRGPARAPDRRCRRDGPRPLGEGFRSRRAGGGLPHAARPGGRT